jgi:hypothetical protein
MMMKKQTTHCINTCRTHAAYNAQVGSAGRQASAGSKQNYYQKWFSESALFFKETYGWYAKLADNNGTPDENASPFFKPHNSSTLPNLRPWIAAQPRCAGYMIKLLQAEKLAAKGQVTTQAHEDSAAATETETGSAAAAGSAAPAGSSAAAAAAGLATAAARSAGPAKTGPAPTMPEIGTATATGPAVRTRSAAAQEAQVGPQASSTTGPFPSGIL